MRGRGDAQPDHRSEHGGPGYSQSSAAARRYCLKTTKPVRRSSTGGVHATGQPTRDDGGGAAEDVARTTSAPVVKAPTVDSAERQRRGALLRRSSQWIDS